MPSVALHQSSPAEGYKEKPTEMGRMLRRGKRKTNPQAILQPWSMDLRMNVMSLPVREGPVPYMVIG